MYPNVDFYPPPGSSSVSDGVTLTLDPLTINGTAISIKNTLGTQVTRVNTDMISSQEDYEVATSKAVKDYISTIAIDKDPLAMDYITLSSLQGTYDTLRVAGLNNSSIELKSGSNEPFVIIDNGPGNQVYLQARPSPTLGELFIDSNTKFRSQAAGLATSHTVAPNQFIGGLAVNRNIKGNIYDTPNAYWETPQLRVISSAYPSGGEQIIISHLATANKATMYVDSLGDMTIDCQGDDLNFHSSDSIHFLNVDDSTLPTNGSVTISGGLGLNKSIRIGGSLAFNSSPNTITSFSTNNELVNNSDNAIVSEKAIKTYTTVKNTGLVFGGTLSIASATTFNIAAGAMWVVNDYTYTNTSTKTYWTWNNLSNITATRLATSAGSWISLFESGGTINILQSTDDLTPLQTRTAVRIGRLAHFDHATITKAFSMPVMYNSDRDATVTNMLTYAVLPQKDKCRISANGANLSINLSFGIMMRTGANYTISTATVNYVTILDYLPVNFRRVYRTSASDIGLSAIVTTLDPIQYESAFGVLSSVPALKYTFQMMDIFPYANDEPTIFVWYGRGYYQTLADCRDSISSFDFVRPSAGRGGLERCAIIMREDVTNLTTAIAAGTALIFHFDR